ncbi:MAG: hypothetical protein DRH08_10890 [Deltaproteobacteria bacterium]|nr:MAG: hypothetical protein DRH08_10890 [Deltaproteobacteria bacterium]
MEGDPEKVVACRHFLKQLIANVQENPELLNSRLFQQQLRDELTCQVLGILSTGRGQVIALPFHKRMKLIKSLKSYLEENGHEHNTVADLCRELQVNERTLRRSLREWYGVSPHQYLLAIRLNGVRQELRRNDPLNTKVCDIANYWSFWHMGNFASVYQRQFGELPSQTLSRESQALTSLTLNCTVSRP